MAFNEDKSWERAQQLYNEKRIDECINELDKLIKNTSTPSRYAYVKAAVYFARNDFASALDTVKLAIEFDSSWADPHKFKAEILYNYYSTPENLDDALNEVNIALGFYDAENNLTEVLEKTPESFAGTVNTYIASRTDISSLKASIQSELRAQQLGGQLEELESKITAERVKNIEFLGVFAAIIALVLANSQAAAKLQGTDILWLNMGLVLPISFLVVLVNNNENKHKALLVITAIAFAGGILGYLLNSMI